MAEQDANLILAPVGRASEVERSERQLFQVWNRYAVILTFQPRTYDQSQLRWNGSRVLLAALCRILLPPNAQESRGKKSAAVKIYLHSAAEGHHLRLKTCAVKILTARG